MQVIMGRSQRSQKSGEDRLSNLPQGVLDHIFSFLTTKEVVRTCVLSKDWERKWTSNCNLIVDDEEFFVWERSANFFFRSKGGKRSFYNFVERVLLVSLSVKEFHLSCHEKHDFSRMTTWISTVLRRRVETIKISCAYKGIILPSNLFNCRSLRNLKLKLRCMYKPLVYNLLANLTTLHLYQVHIENDNSNDTLQFDFPILETFKLGECKWSNVKSVEFYVPRMTEFISWTHPFDYGVNDYSIKIVGTKLANFVAYGGLLQNFNLSKSQVTRANLRHRDLMQYEKLGSKVRQLLRELSSVEKLRISTALMMAIVLSKPGRPLLEYYRLESLDVNFEPSGVGALFELLQVAPFLKFLVVDSRYSYPYRHHKDNYDYTAMESVPSCFLHFLEEVRFDRFTGKRSEYDLAKYVLKNGVKLKKASFFTASHYRKVEEKLLAYPKGSSCLTLLVSCVNSFEKSSSGCSSDSSSRSRPRFRPSSSSSSSSDFDI